MKLGGLQFPLRGVIYFGRRGERLAPHGERAGFESFSKTTLDRAQRDTVEYPLAAESGTRRGRGNLDNRILWMVSELTSTVRDERTGQYSTVFDLVGSFLAARGCGGPANEKPGPNISCEATQVASFLWRV